MSETYTRMMPEIINTHIKIFICAIIIAHYSVTANAANEDAHEKYHSSFVESGFLLRSAAVCSDNQKTTVDAALDIIGSSELKLFKDSYPKTSEQWWIEGAEKFNDTVMKKGIPEACDLAKSLRQGLRESTAESQPNWNEGSQTANECMLYYQTLQQCMGKNFSEKENRNLVSSSELMSKLSWLLAKKAGLSDEAIIARSQLTTKSFIDKLGSNCINISILLRDYSELCGRMVSMWKNKLSNYE